MGDQANGLLSGFLREKRINAARIFIKGKVLDYGCGVGMLCRHIEKNNYLGVDIDGESINMAKRNFPSHKFSPLSLLNRSEKFDTIVGLAVIEHIKDSGKFLVELKTLLNNKGRIVLTTPHPYSDRIHFYGSKLGLFSRSAEEEHEILIDYAKMSAIAATAGLKIIHYKRFLFGINQLFVLENPTNA